jgi:hypothetical protein
VLISHPQEFRRQVQQQIGTHEVGGINETKQA